MQTTAGDEVSACGDLVLPGGPDPGGPMGGPGGPDGGPIGGPGGPGGGGPGGPGLCMGGAPKINNENK